MKWNPRKLALAFLKAPKAVSVYALSRNGYSVFIGYHFPEDVYSKRVLLKVMKRSPLDFTQSSFYNQGELLLNVILIFFEK
tara:strand:- start:302 stop:544 length:243 start_codon:yes stop_codon:yes gene_type:complete